MSRQTEIETIKSKIEDLKYKRFIDEMADFMDWRAYYYLSNEIKKLEDELKNLEKGEEVV